MKIALLGDIALFGKMSTTKNPYVERLFSEIANYLKGFDFVVGNLESPFSIKKRTYGAKSAYVCADTEDIKLLKLLHINAVTLANNHMFDYGNEGYELTKQLLDEAGIAWFGTEGQDYRMEINGNKIAFSGYCCYSSNPLKCVRNGKYGINTFNIVDVKESLKKNQQDGYLNIVSVHAGTEHVNYPSLDHIKTSRLLADVCPYIYYGHHPHVIQGIEEYKGSLIAHSLGNFCFDDVYTDASTTKPLIELTENNRTGIVLELTIDNNQFITWHEQGIYIGREGNIKLVDIKNRLKEYNDRLKYCDINPQGYNLSRQQIIDCRLSERKAQRNLVWILKRLRPRYIRLIIDMKKNRKQYVDNVTKYL